MARPKGTNRLSNLRKATRSNNCANKGLQANNTSGVKGVYWNKQMLRWHAQIRMKGIRKHLGFFKSLDEAKRVYDKWALIWFKEYALTNETIRKEAVSF